MSRSRMMIPAGLLLLGVLSIAGFVSAMGNAEKERTGTVQGRGPSAISARSVAVDPTGEPRQLRRVLDNRTRENPDRATPSAMMSDSTSVRTLPKPPDQVMLAHLEDLYGPVPFDHKGHVDMAGLSTGCVLCHHHTPTGQEHPACRSCHQKATAREDFRMPGLKGAYHRQCLNCHIEWSQDTACNACHVPKARRGVCPDPHPRTSVAEAIGRMSAPLKQPDRCIYKTSYSPAPVITFQHGDHAQTFGVQCIECHRGDSCARCHDSTPARREAPVHHATSGLKNSCLSCHSEAKCSLCHDQAERPRFDHAIRAGWPLEPNHANLQCRECHGPAKDFAVPSTNCHACHAQHRKRNTNATVAAAVGAQGDMDCLACHTDLSDRFAHATTIHGPVAGKTGCSTCHDLSAAASPRPARDRQRELCLGCHNRTLDAGGGRAVANIAALLADNPNLHGPVRDGNCTACHNPHASDHAHLLVREYTPDFYATFDRAEYALCFGCHDERKVLSESGTAVTGFRDGDRKLHPLHVNREKGRTCRVCHEVHASRRPFHIRESVPFGDSSWSLPINFELTSNGGTCAPGCHAPKSYDRAGAARPSTPLSKATGRAGG